MFHFLRQDILEHRGMVSLVGHTAETGALSWIAGRRFPAPPQIRELTIDSTRGDRYPDFFDTSVPVMSNRLVDFLSGLGVHNMDTYPVTLRDQISGGQVSGYSAVNVIGCIDATRLEDSKYRLSFGEPCFTGAIAIDGAKAEGASFFRTLYGPGFIVVSGEIADALRQESWSGILLQPTLEYEGE